MTHEEFEQSMAVHRRKCPAMPRGYRTAQVAMNALGVECAKDKELYVVSETGKGQAAGCLLDSVMSAAGCICGKSNTEKKCYNKIAFTLFDVKNEKSMRVRRKDEFFGNMLDSPVVAQRTQGVLPQNVPVEIVDPLVDKVLAMPEEMFLEIEPVHAYEFPKGKGCFDTDPCSKCDEHVWVNKLTETDSGFVCIPYGKKV